MHTIQILQTSVIRGSIAGQEDFYEGDYWLYGQALSLPIFSLSLESSSGSTSTVRQVLLHVPAQLTHRPMYKCVDRVDKCRTRHTRNSQSRGIFSTTRTNFLNCNLALTLTFGLDTPIDPLLSGLGRNLSNSG